MPTADPRALLLESRDLFRALLELHDASDFDLLTQRVELQVDKLNQALAPRPCLMVAFAGPEGCGKSYAAEHLIKQHGFVRFSFAEPIRDMLKALGVTEAQLSDRTLKESPCALLLGKTPRQAMRTLGTEWGRDLIHPDLWASLALKRLQEAYAAGRRVVLDDCRFANEAETWTKAGGVVVEIAREGCAYNPEHASAAGLPREWIDVTVNNTGASFLTEIEKVALDPGAGWANVGESRAP